MLRRPARTPNAAPATAPAAAATENSDRYGSNAMDARSGDRRIHGTLASGGENGCAAGVAGRFVGVRSGAGRGRE